jgi:hypothetical protein
MEIFWNDEAGYRQWLQTHPDGYVLNLPRRAAPSTYVMLHRATCGHIADPGPSDAPLNYTTNRDYKVCGVDRDRLVSWVATQPGPFKLCSDCRP